MEEKICLVTGVGPGTGTSMVRKFSDGGYKVIMISRSEERLQTLQKEIINTKSFPCDVSKEEDMESIIQQIKAKEGIPRLLRRWIPRDGFQKVL